MELNMNNPNESEICATVAKARAVYPTIPENIADTFISKGMTAEAAGNALHNTSAMIRKPARTRFTPGAAKLMHC
jgi:hypothetical protein